MKEMDLMCAMDAVEDDLLLEADTYSCAHRKVSWVRVVAIAAVVALLAFSVYASYAEARVSFPNEENSVLFRSFEVDGIKYSHMQVEYDLQPVAIKEHATWFMTDMINMVEHWMLEGNELMPYGSAAIHSFESLKIAENFFGLTFDLPEIVREGDIWERRVQLRAEPMYYPDELSPEEAFDYEAELGGADLLFAVGVDDKRLESVTVNIYLGLTEAYTAFSTPGGSIQALELMGEPEIQEIRVGDEEFTVLTFTDDPEGSVEVFYVRDGIGYGLHFYPKEDYNGDPLRLIHSHLKDIG